MKTLLKFFAVGAAFGAALFVYAWQIEPKQLHLRYVELGEGDRVIRLALMSDLHVGGMHVPQSRVRKIVGIINDADVDQVLMPGDFINGHTPRSEMKPEFRRLIDQSLSELGKLEAPAFATLGNHDNWHSPVAIRALLEEAGVVVLDNQAFSDADLCLVGLADEGTASPSVNAFDDCSKGQGVIALMHSPDSRKLLPPDTLMAVAGHTHGGQVNLPFFGRVVTSTECGKPCAYGLIQKDPPILVSSGIGTSILPIRFRSPPEIVLIELSYDPPTTSGKAP